MPEQHWSGQLFTDRVLRPAEAAWFERWMSMDHPALDSRLAEALPDPLRCALDLPIGPLGSFFTGDLHGAPVLASWRPHTGRGGNGAVRHMRGTLWQMGGKLPDGRHFLSFRPHSEHEGINADVTGQYQWLRQHVLALRCELCGSATWSGHGGGSAYLFAGGEIHDVRTHEGEPRWRVHAAERQSPTFTYTTDATGYWNTASASTAWAYSEPAQAAVSASEARRMLAELRSMTGLVENAPTVSPAAPTVPLDRAPPF